MPELPEVEVIRRGLVPLLAGRRIESIRCSAKPLRRQVPIELLRRHLLHGVIIDVKRRAKYLLFPTDRYHLLIIHLGMTGTFRVVPGEQPAARHDHLFFGLDDGNELRFNDTRRFGMVDLIPGTDQVRLEQFFANTGPEPLGVDCTPAYLHQRARRSKQPVKSFIMNAGIVAGVGNIYANESLFAAGIHPATPASKLNRHQWRLLLDTIREILQWAISCGGSTISDFLTAEGRSGYFQVNFKIYGRQGQPCVSCATRIEKKVIGGRASFYCPRCQTPP